MTAAHTNEQIAILAGGRIVLVPTVNGPLSDSILNTGDFSNEDVSNTLQGMATF